VEALEGVTPTGSTRRSIAVSMSLRPCGTMRRIEALKSRNVRMRTIGWRLTG
jgi:hypothetical protein